MKKKSKPDILIAFNTKDGNWKVAPEVILYNPNLSEASKLFLIAALTNDDGWEIYLDFYSRKFDWSPQKQAAVVANLIEQGYMIRTEKKLGKGKGSEYHYIISAYGNLNNELTEPAVQQPSTPQEAQPQSDSGKEQTSAIPEPSPTPTSQELTKDPFDPQKHGWIVFEALLKECNKEGPRKAREEIATRLTQSFRDKINTFKDEMELSNWIGSRYNDIAPFILKAVKEKNNLTPRTYFMD